MKSGPTHEPPESWPPLPSVPGVFGDGITNETEMIGFQKRQDVAVTILGNLVTEKISQDSPVKN